MAALVSAAKEESGNTTASTQLTKPLNADRPIPHSVNNFVGDLWRESYPRKCFCVNAFSACKCFFRWKTRQTDGLDSALDNVFVSASVQRRSTRSGGAIHRGTFSPIVDAATSVCRTGCRRGLPRWRSSSREV